MRIGYLIPQFPGQTHIFFWRELAALEEMGVDVQVFSTRKPPPGLIAHAWSDAAMARTTYLGQVDAVAALRALVALHGSGLLRLVRAEGRGFAKDVMICLSAAWQLRADCKAQGIAHVHVHSCARAAVIALLASLMGGPRYSLTLHGPMSDYGAGQRVKWSHAAFATIITQKLLAEAQAELGDDLPDRVVVRGMGVDVDVLRRQTPYSPPISGEPLRLFSCARLNQVKGHQDLMMAVRLLLDQGQLSIAE